MEQIAREWLVLIALGGLYAAWVLVPLVPAVLIYKLFPSTTVTVNGIFAGLTINASGAFAGYLIVFIGTYQPLVPPTRDIIAGFQRQFWTIKGDVKLVRADGTEYPHSEALLSKLRVVKPHVHKFDSFQATFKIEEEEGELPIILIEIPKFGQKQIPLRSMSAMITVNKFKRTIRINEPIVIAELAPGGAVRPAPVAPTRWDDGSTEATDLIN
jgi:hypothetical protein